MFLDVYTDILGYLFWILLFIAMLSPWLSMRSLQHARLRLIEFMERKYGSRVITMIHRQEKIGLLGVPIYRYIDIEDSEAIIRPLGQHHLICRLCSSCTRQEVLYSPHHR